MSLSRDTTESDLKQRREITSGTALHIDQVGLRELLFCLFSHSFTNDGSRGIRSGRNTNSSSFTLELDCRVRIDEL